MTEASHDQSFADLVHEIFSEKIPFNKLLGLEILSLEPEKPQFRFDMRPELVGNFTRGNLHGGVISAVLDVTGGLAAFLAVYQQMADEPLEKQEQRFSRLGTIDMRVDYLRPGLGEYFVSTGYLQRSGSKVAVTRMELHNNENVLIAVGTGAYVVA